MPNPSLDHALALWRRGLSVIPVPRPDGRHDGKVPVLAWREFQGRRATEAEVRAWFAAPMNVAVVTGKISDVVVVDADSPEALAWIRRRLPYTAWQTKTSRGYHLFYRHPGVLVRNAAKLETNNGRLALDVRGDAGFVIAAGSVHASGALYEFAGDWTVDRDALPHFWPGWLQRLSRPSRLTHIGPRPTGDVAERARKYLAAIPKPEIGSGSDTATLYAACRVVRGFDLSEVDAVELLHEWAGGRPGWTREWIESKVHAALKYGREPVGGLR